MQCDHIGSVRLPFGNAGRLPSFEWRQLWWSYKNAKVEAVAPDDAVFN